MESSGNMSGNFIYNRIYNDLLQQIKTGQLSPGQKLKTEMELCQIYGVSRESVRRALSMLETDGYIIRKVSAGTFVQEKKTEYAPSSFHQSFTEQMIQHGKHPSSLIRSIELLSDEIPTQVVKSMNITAGERVYRVKRIRLADDVPMAYEIAYIRQKLCPNLHTKLLEDTSLYQLYEDYYHLDMGTIDLKIEAVSADSSLQKLLNLKRSMALLKMTSLMHLRDETPLYYVICYHVGELYEYKTSMPRKLP